MSSLDLYSYLEDPKVGQISIPLKDGTKLRLECVAQVSTPPHLKVRFLTGQLPIDEIDMEGKCLFALDMGGPTITLITSITNIENDSRLTLVNVESISHEQKRDFFRIDAQIPVNLHPISPAKSTPLIGESINISGNGIQVAFTEPFTVDQRVRLQISITNSESREVQCVAHVVRVTKKKLDGYKVAFCFDEITEEDQDAIMAFCFSQQRKHLRLKVRVLGPA